MGSPQAHVSYFALFLIWLWGWGWFADRIMRNQNNANLGGTDRRRGWVFVCWGTRVSFLQQGARRTCPVLFSCFLSSTRLPPKCAETIPLVSRHDGWGWIFCPCMCLHESWLWSPQQIVYNPSASLGKLIYDYYIDHHFSFVFLSFQMSCTGFFSFISNHLWMTWRWGDKSD